MRLIIDRPEGSQTAKVTFEGGGQSETVDMTLDELRAYMLKSGQTEG